MTSPETRAALQAILTAPLDGLPPPTESDCASVLADAGRRGASVRWHPERRGQRRPTAREVSLQLLRRDPAREWSAKELAHTMGVSAPTVRQIMQGHEEAGDVRSRLEKATGHKFYQAGGR